MIDHDLSFENASDNDRPTLIDLYQKGIETQRSTFGKHWLFIDTDMLDVEVSERRLWKVVENDEIACIFSVTYSDAVLWNERNADSAVYIHCIVTDPGFRGRGFVSKITQWAKQHA